MTVGAIATPLNIEKDIFPGQNVDRDQQRFGEKTYARDPGFALTLPVLYAGKDDFFFDADGLKEKFDIDIISQRIVGTYCTATQTTGAFFFIKRDGLLAQGKRTALALFNTGRALTAAETSTQTTARVK